MLNVSSHYVDRILAKVHSNLRLPRYSKDYLESSRVVKEEGEYARVAPLKYLAISAVGMSPPETLRLISGNRLVNVPCCVKWKSFFLAIAIVDSMPGENI